MGLPSQLLVSASTRHLTMSLLASPAAAGSPPSLAQDSQSCEPFLSPLRSSVGASVSRCAAKLGALPADADDWRHAARPSGELQGADENSLAGANLVSPQPSSLTRGRRKKSWLLSQLPNKTDTPSAESTAKKCKREGTRAEPSRVLSPSLPRQPAPLRRLSVSSSASVASFAAPSASFPLPVLRSPSAASQCSEDRAALCTPDRQLVRTAASSIPPASLPASLPFPLHCAFSQPLASIATPSAKGDDDEPLASFSQEDEGGLCLRSRSRAALARSIFSSRKRTPFYASPYLLPAHSLPRRSQADPSSTPGAARLNAWDFGSQDLQSGVPDRAEATDEEEPRSGEMPLSLLQGAVLSAATAREALGDRPAEEGADGAAGGGGHLPPSPSSCSCSLRSAHRRRSASCGAALPPSPSSWSCSSRSSQPCLLLPARGRKSAAALSAASSAEATHLPPSCASPPPSLPRRLAAVEPVAARGGLSRLPADGGWAEGPGGPCASLCLPPQASVSLHSAFLAPCEGEATRSSVVRDSRRSESRLSTCALCPSPVLSFSPSPQIGSKRGDSLQVGEPLSKGASSSFVARSVRRDDFSHGAPSPSFRFSFAAFFQRAARPAPLSAQGGQAARGEDSEAEARERGGAALPRPAFLPAADVRESAVEAEGAARGEATAAQDGPEKGPGDREDGNGRKKRRMSIGDLFYLASSAVRRLSKGRLAQPSATLVATEGVAAEGAALQEDRRAAAQQAEGGERATQEAEGSGEDRGEEREKGGKAEEGASQQCAEGAAESPRERAEGDESQVTGETPGEEKQNEEKNKSAEGEASRHSPPSGVETDSPVCVLTGDPGEGLEDCAADVCLPVPAANGMPSSSPLSSSPPPSSLDSASSPPSFTSEPSATPSSPLSGAAAPPSIAPLPFSAASPPSAVGSQPLATLPPPLCRSRRRRSSGAAALRFFNAHAGAMSSFRASLLNRQRTEDSGTSVGLREDERKASCKRLKTGAGENENGVRDRPQNGELDTEETGEQTDPAECETNVRREVNGGEREGGKKTEEERRRLELRRSQAGEEDDELLTAALCFFGPALTEEETKQMRQKAREEEERKRREEEERRRQEEQRLREEEERRRIEEEARRKQEELHRQEEERRRREQEQRKKAEAQKERLRKQKAEEAIAPTCGRVVQPAPLAPSAPFAFGAANLPLPSSRPTASSKAAASPALCFGAAPPASPAVPAPGVAGASSEASQQIAGRLPRLRIRRTLPNNPAEAGCEASPPPPAGSLPAFPPAASQHAAPPLFGGAQPLQAPVAASPGAPFSPPLLAAPSAASPPALALSPAPAPFAPPAPVAAPVSAENGLEAAGFGSANIFCAGGQAPGVPSAFAFKPGGGFRGRRGGGRRR
ncbi:hypothetical protein BESB_066450 [Besnoitia besnoiti]|uniref:Uncharacterized protein n=1 Tax=Besnoitia besnoiti TaxID=94643 RepID=A0A2A9MGT3_BESBE|nr:hypothetical protein BESB_066450 [Besnoitia besnoiti]PFH34612.1 hypothetical protein BESB_066450 [Besnoitia besnoiti]